MIVAWRSFDFVIVGVFQFFGRPLGKGNFTFSEHVHWGFGGEDVSTSHTKGADDMLKSPLG